MFTVLEIVSWLARFVMAVPFLLILVLIGAAIYASYSARRSVKIASRSPCPRCGIPPGWAAVTAAKERFAEKFADLRKEHPGMRFRVMAEWEIKCPHCGGTFFLSRAGQG